MTESFSFSTFIVSYVATKESALAHAESDWLRGNRKLNGSFVTRFKYIRSACDGNEQLSKLKDEIIRRRAITEWSFMLCRNSVGIL